MASSGGWACLGLIGYTRFGLKSPGLLQSYRLRVLSFPRVPQVQTRTFEILKVSFQKWRLGGLNSPKASSASHRLGGLSSPTIPQNYRLEDEGARAGVRGFGLPKGSSDTDTDV